MTKANYSGLSRYVGAARAPHYDTFELPKAARRLPADQLVISFCTDRERNVANLTTLFEFLAKDIVFTRFPAGDCRIPPSVGSAPARLFTQPRLLLSDRMC